VKRGAALRGVAGREACTNQLVIARAAPGLVVVMRTGRALEETETVVQRLEVAE
jgi:hypothetical protein